MIEIDTSRPQNYDIPTEAIEVYLSQIVDIDGEGVILAETPVYNCSGREVGTLYTVSDDTWEEIVASFEAYEPLPE
ncbi:MAG: hypothetical protein LBE08_01830 [Bifidobacteriaceae bacterium]|nr:hypothetical protein [Bifidobacteriaceae bacterium]